MAWKDTLLPCSFRGIEFDVIDIEDELGRAVSVAEYPYVNGGETEDLGDKSTRYSLNAIFFGDDYEERVAAFLEALDVPGAGELVHPVWGSIPLAQFAGGSVRHAATEPDACTIRLTFIESTPEKPFWDTRLATQKADAITAPGDEATAAAGEQAATAVDQVRDANPLAQLDALRVSMTGPILAGIHQVQGVLQSGLDVLAYPRAWVADIGAIVDGMLGIANFPNNLASQWKALGTMLSSIGARASGGSRITPGYSRTSTQAINANAVYLSVAAATTKANGAAQILSMEATAPTLSPVEIEAIANEVRTDLEAAASDARLVYEVEQARAITEPLKAQALAVQEAAQAIIEARPPLLSRRIEGYGNLRLVAHRWYGDHTRAAELYRLNPTLRLPNNLQPGDSLDAYAS